MNGVDENRTGEAARTLATGTHEIRPGVHYVHKADHRDNSPQKSQWAISEADERNVFGRTLDERWYEEATGWGLHLTDNVIQELGIGVDRMRRLFVAKFVDGNRKSEWHGYPADHLANQRDVPDGSYLVSWCERGYMSIAKMRKIVQRKPCSL